MRKMETASGSLEAQIFGEIRFYPSVASAFRPTLQITFVRRFPFGAP